MRSGVRLPSCVFWLSFGVSGYSWELYYYSTTSKYRSTIVVCVPGIRPDYTGAHPLLALAGASALDHYTGAPPPIPLNQVKSCVALRDRRCATGPLGGTAHRTTRPPPPSPRDPRLPSPRGRRSPDPPLASSSTRNRVHPDGKPGKRKDTRMKRTGFRLFRFDRSCVSGCVVFRDLSLNVDSTIAGGTTQIAGISRIHTIFGGVGTL